MGRRKRYIQPGSNISPEKNGNLGGELNMNNLGQLFNNIDMNQLMGQLSQMMGGMGGPQGGGPQQGGFQGAPQGPQGGFQGAPQGGFQGAPQGGFQPPRQSMPRDPRIQLLQAVKPFLPRRRVTIIDNIGQLYNIAAILRGFKR